MTRVAIVGSGIGGLQLAHLLRSRGLEPTVFEALDRPGGVLHSIDLEGRILETGPQRTRLTPGLLELVRELGLEDEVVTAPPGLPLFVYRAGALRRAPLSFSDLLRTDLLGVRTRARVLLEPFTAGPSPDETVADYMTRRFGRAAYEDLLGPLFGGLYASDPADMRVADALVPLLRDMGAERSAVVTLARRRFRTSAASPPCSFRTGLGALTDAMYRRVADAVRLDSPVHGIRRHGGGWILDTGIGDAFDHVVLTVPAPAAARILADAAPDAAARLARLRYNRLAVVHLQSDARMHGLGFQTSFAETLETRGVTFNGSLFGPTRAGVFTAFLGGARNPALPDLPDGTIADIAAREFRVVTGQEARILAVSRTMMPSWDRSWAALDGLHLPDGIHLAANYESRVGIPGRLRRAEIVARTLTRVAQAA